MNGAYAADFYAISSALLFQGGLRWCDLIPDSVSTLQTLHAYTTDHTDVTEIVQHVSHLHSGEKYVICYLVPGLVVCLATRVPVQRPGTLLYMGNCHVTGLLADTATSGCFLCLVRCTDPLQDNKLGAVISSAHVWQFYFRSVRTQDVIVTRLRIGYTRLALRHSLRGEPVPVCVHCGAPLTI